MILNGESDRPAFSSHSTLTPLLQDAPSQQSKTFLLDLRARSFDECDMVTTKLSSKGQVVLPRLVRSRLGLAPGVRLRCEVRGESVVLTPQGVPRRNKEYVVDPLSGLRVVKPSPVHEPVTSEMVKELLEEFP